MLSAKTLHRVPTAETGLDLLGQSLVTTGTVILIYRIIQGGHHGFGSTTAIMNYVLAGFSFAGFLLRERSVPRAAG